MTTVQINPQVFREYDIRGEAERDFSNDFVTALGRSIGTLLKQRGKRRIALGRDCRLSSPRLHAALLDGLVQTGMHIVDIGVVPSPLLYFAVFHLDLDGGVQITGSHNPPQDNGFKLMSGKDAMHGADIQALRQLISSGDFERGGSGRIESLDMLPAYTGYMRGNLKIDPLRLRFAVDAGNGAGGPTALAAMRALGLEPIAMLCDMDGHFPVHHPDPSEPHNLELLRQKVLSEKLDLGIAYDGDADRIGVIDSRGEVVWGDRLMVVLARDILSRHPGAKIIGEVKCSQTMYDDIATHGGTPIIWKTGHSLLKAKIKEEKALLAGEMSGHIFFADRYYGFDDAIYVSLRLLEILAATPQSLHELLADLPPTFSTPEIRVECGDDRKFAIVERVKQHFAATHEVLTIDGARIHFKDGWGLVRASNTQPILVLRFESTTADGLARIRHEVEDVVHIASTQNG